MDSSSNTWTNKKQYQTYRPNLGRKKGCVTQTHKQDLTITTILCMDESLMGIILLTLFVDELNLTSTKDSFYSVLVM